MSALDDVLDTIFGFLGGVTDDISATINNLIDSTESTANNIIDGVDNTFNNIIDGVDATINNAIASVNETVNNAISGVETTLNNAINAVNNNINNIITGVTTLSAEIITGVTTTIDNAIAGVNAAINSVASSVESSISNGLASIGATVSSITGQIVSGVEATVSAVAQATDNILTPLTTGLGNLATGIGSAFATAADVIAAPLKALAAGIGLLSAIVPSPGTIATIGALVADAKNAITAYTAVPAEAGSPIRRHLSDALYSVIANLGALIGSPLGLLPVVQDIYAASVSQYVKLDGMRIYRPTRLAMGEGVELVKRGLMDEAELMTYADELGYEDIDKTRLLALGQRLTDENSSNALWRRGAINYDAMIERLVSLGYTIDDAKLVSTLSRQLLSTGDFIQLWRRGELDDTGLAANLNTLGYEAEDISRLRSLSEIIPGVNDLILMAVRDTWDEDVVKTYGYDESFPPEVAEWAAKQGLAPEWAKRYWRAHWQLPGPQLGYEMLQRGLISLSELDDLLRIADYPKYWRERLVKLSYTPFTRVDIRRMYELKVLTRPQMVTAYMDIGYDAVKAEMMAVFTERLVNKDDQVAKSAERNLSASEIISLYTEGYIETSELRGMLSLMGYDDTEVDFKIALATAKVTKTAVSKEVELYKLAYLYSDEPLTTFVDRCNKLGLSQYEIDGHITDIRLAVFKAQLKVDKAKIRDNME